jgi:sialidase-1
MTRLFISLLLAVCALTIAHAQTKVPVFISGEEGHSTYRIPSIINLPNGDLLAIAEGRVHGEADFGDVNLVMKRSTDRGRTWNALRVLIDNVNLQAGNPAPVVDLLDPQYPQGRIFLFYNTGNNHENEVRKGNGFREAWYITSHDNGMTWSDPVNITKAVHRPKQPNANPEYNFDEDWRSYANTPGHALQLTSGPYRGRIFVPANHSAGELHPESKDFSSHGYYTDDHGRTFHLSNTVNIAGSNEATAAELGDGSLIMNMRNQSGDKKARIVAISSTGGASWDTAYFDMNLPDPVCQGSILTIGKRKGKSILAFSNAADEHNRDNLTLRISFDDGKTWPVSKVVDRSPSGKELDHAAYSDLVKMGKRKVGVLYEQGDYSRILFSVIRWK